MVDSSSGTASARLEPETSTTVDKTDYDSDFMKDMRDNYDRARQREHENIIEAYLDLGFRCGDAQWDATAYNERTVDRRPCLIVNILPQFIRQVTGRMRQERPGLKVLPVDERATPKTAEVLTNLVRYVENRSDAMDAYFNGCDQQVTAGVGHWRIGTEYASESTFEQELIIERIEDGISVLWDPDAVKATREDATFCFVPVDMSRGAFDKAFPGKTADSMEQHDYQWRTEWATDDHVRVSEYWLKVPKKRKIATLPDGSTMEVDSIKDPQIKSAVLAQAQIQEKDGHEIQRYLVSLTDILEDKQVSPGRYIPIVPCFGEEIRIGRRLVRHGMVRFMRDPQRMYNYYASAETEIVALQPKAPWIGTEQNFADPEILAMWQNANLKNYPFLIYRPDPSNAGREPTRGTPPLSSQGIIEGLKRAEEDMYRVSGIYPSSLGQPGNETSGKAINSRQGQGDTGTYIYFDNFARAIKHTGRILIDMIPHIYDTQRTVRILGEDGEVDSAELNKRTIGMQGLQLVQRIENDVTVGVYDVMPQVGPSYQTKREEAKEGMLMLMQTAPQFGPLIMDLVAKAQDWPLAEQIAERAHMLLPPNIQMAEMAKKQGVPDEQIQQQMLQQAMQPKPDPKQQEVQAKIQGDQQKAQADLQIKGQKHQADMQMAAQKHQAEMQGKAVDAQTEMLHAHLEQQNAKMEQMTQQILNAIKVQQAEIDLALSAAKLQHQAQQSKKDGASSEEHY